MENQRVVITGGPSAGKTSLINVLEKQGYSCCHEFSRELINENIRLKNGILPWEKLDLFSEKVFTIREKQFHAVGNLRLVFFDRSLLDVIAYLRLDKFKVPESFEKKAKALRYCKTVFLAPFWEEIYEIEVDRQESKEKSQALEHSIRETYEAFGYQIIMLPKLPVLDRAAFIKQYMGLCSNKQSTYSENIGDILLLEKNKKM